jgi:hypothetical protein
VTDEDLRALERQRDAQPGDVGLARKAALLASRLGGREEAAACWQEVLRRSPRDVEAEQRLRGLGCELLYRSTVLGIERFESTRDGTILARTPALPAVFVGERAITCKQFHRFLDAHPRVGDRGWIREVGDNPFRLAEASLSLRGIRSPDPVRHATWEGATAYARWASGRLLAPEEWTKLLVLRALGFELLDAEWSSATRTNERGGDDRGVMSPSGLRWVRARARYEGPAFRYARESWFSEAEAPEQP